MLLAPLVLGHGVLRAKCLHGISPTAHRLAPAVMVADDDTLKAERAEKMRQLFGGDYMTEEAKELARVTTVVQPQKAEPMPEWTNPVPEGMSERAWAIKRMALWLEDAGVDLDKVDLVPTADKQSLALVTATDVPAGATLFEIPDELLFTADTAYSDPDVGRDLRAMASKRQPGRDDDDGFDTFAIGAALAVERVQRGAVRGRLRRQDGGMQVGMINFATDGSAGELLPQWGVQEAKTLQSNRRFSPFIAALDWPDVDECVVEVERAKAVERGAEIIGRLIEPAARRAWMKNTQSEGAIAQATSDEDVNCRALEALLVAIDAQLEPPPPIGDPDGERRWGGRARNGPALCPLANLVMPSSDIVAAAREEGRVNAQLGRPSTGRADVAIRCVASCDLPTGTLILSDVPGASGPIGPALRKPQMATDAPALRPRSRVEVVSGEWCGQVGTVLTRRPDKSRVVYVVRMEDQRLVPMPATSLKEIVDDADEAEASK